MKYTTFSDYDYWVHIDRKAFDRVSKAARETGFLGTSEYERELNIYQGSQLAVGAVKDMFPLRPGDKVAFMVADHPILAVLNLHAITSMVVHPDYADDEKFEYYALNGYPVDYSTNFIALVFLYAYLNGGFRVVGNRGNRMISVGAKGGYSSQERRIRMEDIYAQYVRASERREHQGGTHASPVRHMVREHLRRLKDGRVVVVRSHERGRGDKVDRVRIV